MDETMELLLSDPFGYLDVFLLVFVRIISMMISVPFLGNRNVPNIAKIVTAVYLSVIMINVIPMEAPVSSLEPVNFAITVVFEFLTGWLYGFGIYMVFSIMTLAGQFIDYQIGFSMVNVFDPLSQTNLTITGNLYYFMLMMALIVTRTYEQIVVGLRESFRYIPLGQMTLSPMLYDSFVGFFTKFFETGLLIASPIFFVILISNVVLGVLARTVPQMNMFVIGFPLKLISGLVVLWIVFPIFNSVINMIFDIMKQIINDFILGMSP